MNDGGLHRSEAGFKALKLGLIAKRKNPMYMYSMKKVVKALRRLAYCSLIIIPAILLSDCSEDLYGKVTVTDQQPPQTGAPTLAAPEITASVNKNYYRTTDTPNITITAETGATITYYRNGDPSTETGYTGNFPINSSVSSITAYATHPGYNDSATTTREFYFEPSGNIVTIAGRSTGDNGSYAIQAELFHPEQVIAVQGTPLFYITEATRNRVRTIDSDSRIQAYAGLGAAGSTTDGDLAINAMMTTPSGVCSDGNNFFIVDPGNETVLQVTTGGPDAGTITTVCSATNTNSAFQPTGICYDIFSSRLCITDAGNDCVWSAPISLGIVSIPSMIGGSSGVTMNPASVCSDPANGTLYVVSASQNTVWRIPVGVTATAFISLALQGAVLSDPSGICTDSTYVYIADTGNHCIRRVHVNGPIAAADITVIAGTSGTSGFSGDRGPATSALLNSPEGVFVYQNQVYIADTGNNCIRQILRY